MTGIDAGSASAAVAALNVAGYSALGPPLCGGASQVGLGCEFHDCTADAAGTIANCTFSSFGHVALYCRLSKVVSL